MKTQVVNMRPSEAIELLKNNSKNRPLDERLVKELMAYIQNDQWKLTHQGVGISETGDVLDGQHRLTAISRQKKTVPILVTTGLPDSIMSVIDIGKKRTVADIFALREVSNPAEIAAAIAKYYRFRAGAFYKDPSFREGEIVSTDQRYQFYLEHQKLIEKALAMVRPMYQKFKFYTRTDVAALTMHLVLDRRHSFASVEDFFAQVHMMDDHEQVPATKKLCHILLKFLTGREKINYKHKMALTIKAWNFYKTSADVARLQFDEQREDFPKLK